MVNKIIIGIGIITLILLSGCYNKESQETIYIKYTQEYLNFFGGNINDTFIVLEEKEDLYCFKNINDNTTGFTKDCINKNWVYEISIN